MAGWSGGGGDLRRLAAAAGVTTWYRDWRGRRVEVGEATLAAVLHALGDGGSPAQAGHTVPGPAGGRGAGPGSGGFATTSRWPRRGAADPAAPHPPPRAWGFTAQLYSVRSRASWGHGDFADLAELAVWSARSHGAGFLLINPLHAAEPAPPISPSPYLPVSRRFLSPLYLRVEDVPEYARLPAADRATVESLAAPMRAASLTPALIDRDAVWRAKRAALELVRAVPVSPGRRAEFERFLVAGGRALADWGMWCALAEVHGPDWRAWPVPLRQPRSAAVTTERHRLAGRVRFHQWLQWLADSQRGAAGAAARAAGMAIGVISDLAVGSHPGGADTWADQGVMAAGVTVGAPPDEFNQRGQDWAQRPWHPGRLLAADCEPLGALARAGVRHSGGLRADHVMGLFRLWWIPEGAPASAGTYVRYPHQATVATVTREAARAGALAIGEDLGTVEPWVRDYLAARAVLGTSMLWFERTRSGAPLPPERWRHGCLATVGTHDLPPATAFLTGEQVTLREELGLLPDPAAERVRAATAVAAWCDALTRRGLLPRGTLPEPARFTAALYAYLAATPAALIGVSLADAVGDRRPQNMPGTIDEYPNWRVPLCDGDGAPVPLADLASHPGVTAAAAAAAG